MKDFTESDRFEIRGLTPESVVLDVGGFEGNWGRQIVEKYDCHAHIFEPIDQFYKQIMASLTMHPQRAKMTVHHLGIGGTTRREKMGIKGDSSGLVADGPQEEVTLLGVADLFGNSLFADKTVACMKLNCETAEYEILEAMLEHGLMSRVDTLHVQFHRGIPRAEERMNYIKQMMLLTHRPIFSAPFVWEGWEIK